MAFKQSMGVNVGNIRVVVIGAGVGGLVAAIELARRGFDVTVIERHAEPGGKLRRLPAGDRMVDAGPTVFTMRWVFERIFEDAGASLPAMLDLRPLHCLARHAWSDRQSLDLFSDIDASARAITQFAGSAEASGYRDFCSRARGIYETLERSFINASQPTLFTLILRSSVTNPAGLMRVSPYQSFWSALGDHFRDDRLRQLFARYATYCGTSPFHAPATLMLVAHVEQSGVWIVDGGMSRLAEALTKLAETCGARIVKGRSATDVVMAAGNLRSVKTNTNEDFPAEAVIVNADAAAVAGGFLGSQIRHAVNDFDPSGRSLSAVTWTMLAETGGFELSHHNVFFSHDYRREFDDIESGRLPEEPTIYLCAQDRLEGHNVPPAQPERLLMLVNAPANGDTTPLSAEEIAECKRRTLARLAACGLNLRIIPETVTQTAPQDFHQMFPGTGGALYGAAARGWASSFSRPEARTRIPGLYLAGGSVHPGPGVPMAAISGWLAAASLIADLDSRTRWSRVVMPGGMSTA
jgi:1-hydroxycarotenoid 3,4-desaturase